MALVEGLPRCMA